MRDADHSSRFAEHRMGSTVDCVPARETTRVFADENLGRAKKIMKNGSKNTEKMVLTTGYSAFTGLSRYILLSSYPRFQPVVSRTGSCSERTGSVSCVSKCTAHDSGRRWSTGGHRRSRPHRWSVSEAPVDTATLPFPVMPLVKPVTRDNRSMSAITGLCGGETLRAFFQLV
jgi:hypothetical protein